MDIKNNKVDMESKPNFEGEDGYEHLYINNFARLDDKLKKELYPVEPKILTFDDMINIVDEHLVKGMVMYIVKYHTGEISIYTDRDCAIWNYVTDLIDKACEDNNLSSISDIYTNEDSLYMDKYGYKNWEKYWRRDMKNEYRKMTLYNDTKVGKWGYLIEYLVNCSIKDTGITENTSKGVCCIVGVDNGDTLGYVFNDYLYGNSSSNDSDEDTEDYEDEECEEDDDYEDEECEEDDDYEDEYEDDECDGDCEHCNWRNEECLVMDDNGNIVDLKKLVDSDGNKVDLKGLIDKGDYATLKNLINNSNNVTVVNQKGKK